MATINPTTVGRSSSTSLPAQVDSPQIAAPTADTGHPGASGFQTQPVGTTDATLPGAKTVAPGVDKVSGSAVVEGAASARAASIKAKAADVAKAGKQAQKALKGAHAVIDEDSTTSERIDGAMDVGRAAKAVLSKTKVSVIDLSASTIKAGKVGVYGAGAISGAANAVRNANELPDNVAKAMKGDTQAMGDAVNNLAQIASGSARVVKDVGDGAKLVGATGAAARTLIAVSGAGMMATGLRALPVLGGVAGSLVAYDAFKSDKSLSNGLKVAVNVVGSLPIPFAGSVAAAATLALSAPAVEKAVNAGGARMAKNWEAMKDAEPMGAAI
jgi:hypothetical protein